jgi:hypothetical protein
MPLGGSLRYIAGSLSQEPLRFRSGMYFGLVDEKSLRLGDKRPAQ